MLSPEEPLPCASTRVKILFYFHTSYSVHFVYCRHTITISIIRTDASGQDAVSFADRAFFLSITSPTRPDSPGSVWQDSHHRAGPTAGKVSPVGAGEQALTIVGVGSFCSVPTRIAFRQEHGLSTSHRRPKAKNGVVCAKIRLVTTKY